ncbi:MAG: hypothetical protein FWG62_03490 [Proteobacteria bacterium]|nr:hypothetical protein [Pseudomonadota bacterium]
MNEYEDKKNADRRLALLVLTSEPPGPLGPCPSAETLAALVEGRLAPEEAKTWRAHLADCETCYGQWLQLDRQWQQNLLLNRKTTLLRLVSKPRFLTTMGSVLAAAASVALILNLPFTQRGPINLPAPQEKTMEHQAAAPAADIAAPQAEPAPPAPLEQPLMAPEPLARPVEPAKMAMRQQAKSEAGHRADGQGANIAGKAAPQAATTARERDQREIKEKAADLAAARQDVETGHRQERQQEVKTLPAAPPAPAQMAASSPQPEQERIPVTAEDWYSHIRQGCQGTPRADFFTAVAAQGEALLRGPGPLSSQDRQRIKSILAELGGKRPVADRCAALLELLGPTTQRPRQE